MAKVPVKDATTFDSVENGLCPCVGKKVMSDDASVAAHVQMQTAAVGHVDMSAYLPHHGRSWSLKQALQSEEKAGSSSQRRVRRNRRSTVNLEITLPHRSPSRMDGEGDLIFTYLFAWRMRVSFFLYCLFVK